MNREINNFNSCEISKNRFMKMKKSSSKATLIHLFFKIFLPYNAPIENTNKRTITIIGLPELYF